MPTDLLESSERVVFEGALGVSTAVAVALLLAAVTAWTIWRSRETLGAGWSIAFWALRMIALGVALWMVVGPVQENIQRSTIPQSITILSDASQSMETIDAADPTAALRWHLAISQQGEQSDKSLAYCDRAGVAIGVAKRSCEQAIQELEDHRPVRQIRRSIEEANIAVERAIEHCAQIEKELGSGQDDLHERIARVETQLTGPIVESLNSLHGALNASGDAALDEIEVSLQTLNESIQGVDRRLERLADDMAARLADQQGVVSAETDELTRRQRAGRTLDMLEKSVLAELSEEVRINRYQFDERLQPVATGVAWNDAADFAPESDGGAAGARGTNLTEVLKQLAKNRTSDSTRLAVLFSDGHHNDINGPAPQEVANDLADLPVYVVPVGNAGTVRDIRLHRVEAPATIIENDSGVIDAIVTAFDCDGRTAEVLLRQNGKEIDRQTVEFVGDRIDRRVQFRVSADEVGWQEYELVVDPVDEEVSEANNVAQISWEVVRDKLRVLLADGIPQWEYRYLQQLFRRDSHIEFDELLFYPKLRATGALATKRRLPQSVEDWAIYDVVILGDIGPQQFSRASQESLAEFVRQGHGHAIIIAGQDQMPSRFAGQPLVDLLPVEDVNSGRLADSYGVVMTDEGRLNNALAIEDSTAASEATWSKAFQKKPIYRLSTYCRPKSTARTLLRAVPTTDAVVVDEKTAREDQRAFLCWHQVGGGRVVYLAAPQTWALRYRRGDRPHHRFWGQLLRWVTTSEIGSGTERLRLATDQTRYHMNEPIEVTAWLKDETGRPLAGQSLQAKVRLLEKEISAVELESDPNVAGRYFASIRNLSPGAYEIVAGGSAVEKLLKSEELLAVRRLVTIEASGNIEMQDTRCNRPLLEQLAKMTGGQVVPPTAIDEVLMLASLSPEVTETIQRTPLWNRWQNLWIVLGCLSVEWIVRKRKGLV